MRHKQPEIKITELLARARDSFETEIQFLRTLAEMQGLPYDSIRDDVDKLKRKADIITEMYHYFSGEWR